MKPAISWEFSRTVVRWRRPVTLSSGWQSVPSSEGEEIARTSGIEAA